LTLEQCLRTLPFDEALAVADSALREGAAPEVLQVLARDVRGPGAPRVRAVLATATGLAANPFESVLRALTLEVPGLRVRPQVQIGGFRPDLVDEDLRIVLEADSFAWHGSRAALRRDAQRYNELVIQGWLVLRFAWEDVMHRPELVRETLARAVLCAQRRSEVGGVG
jgi:very-short-patch-repair endonuclease